MVNEVTLIGNLGDDVKMHYFEGGGSIARFPLATSRQWTDKESGEKKEKVNWHNVVVRNKTAELCEKYVKKGDRLYVKGSIEYGSYENDKKEKIYTTEITGLSIKFLQPVDKDPNKQSESAPPLPPVGEKDDLPF